MNEVSTQLYILFEKCFWCSEILPPIKSDCTRDEYVGKGTFICDNCLNLVKDCDDCKLNLELCEEHEKERKNG